MRRTWPIVILVLASIALGCGGPKEGTPARRAQLSRELQSRLLAPCCWQQTLDVHTGPTVDKLRDEIDQRLAAGESVGAIEADMVTRYGAKIRAMPPGKTLNPLGIGLIVASALAFAGAIFVGVRWVRRGRKRATQEAAAPPVAARKDAKGDQALEDRLDEELEEMD